KSYDVRIEEGWRADKIAPAQKHHLITAKNANGEEKNWETKTVIIATGIHPRQLRVPGEKEFDRKGVTYCSVCDGPLYRGKITVTIGSGNSALESALMMASLAKKVYLLSKYTDTPEHNGGFPRGENVLVDKLKSSPNVEIIYGAETTEIKGDKKVTGLVYRDTAGQKQTLAVDGIMVHIGMVPNSQLVDCEKDKIGQIMVNARCETSIPGVYAAGDVTNIPYKQIGVAAGQGIIASLSAIEYLNRFKE
ncbi:MAG TPA: FAD-dependent oxidoreductase, partial [Patescibacteria group bacterium]|nr:FAD-dependent oxidoreductase [Patescibacteria group bacterium]